MKVLATLRSLVSSLLHRSAIEVDMDEELRSHIQHRADVLQRSGMTPAEAKRRAHVEFGGYQRIKEECREAIGAHVLETLVQDVRFGLRMLRRSPGFTAIAVTTLTVGIGVNTSIFSLIYTLAIRPLPVKDASSLASVYQNSPGSHSAPRGVQGSPYYLSYPEYVNYRDGDHVFSGLAAYAETTVSLSSADPEPLHGLLASCNYFDVLRASLVAGRGFGPSDCRASEGSSVVVLSNGFWRRNFGGDPGVVGKRLILDNQVFTVIGVAAAEFSGTELQVPDVWVPVATASQLMPNTFGTRDWLSLPNVSWLHVVGHLKPGITGQRAEAELTILARRMDANFPGRRSTVIVNAGAFLNNPEWRSMGVWLAAGLIALAGLVLLMACTNVTNLLLARAAARQQEIGVRLALGAKRSRLVRQLLTESVLFALLSGIAGVVVAYWLSPVLVRVLPEMPTTGLPLNWSPDFAILCYALLASLCAAVFSGLAPALHTTKLDLITIVKEDTAASGQATRRTRLRTILVGAQVAGCTLFLVLASLLVRGLHRAENINPGFSTKNVYVISADLSQKRYDGQHAYVFARELRHRLAALPRVAGVASSVVLPCVTGYLSGVTVANSKGYREETVVAADLVSSGYFKTMEIPILRGHAFTAQEAEAAGPTPAVISLAMKQRFWRQEDAIGKEFSAAQNFRYRVVGIAPDLQNQHLGQKDGPFYYGALAGGKSDAVDAKIFVRSAGNTSGLLSAIPEIVRQLDSTVMVTTESYEQILSNQLTPARTGAVLVGILGFLATILAVVGITGVVSYVASQRIHEIGIRMALGAQPHDVIALFVRQSAKVVAIGLSAGLALSAACALLLSAADLLFGVSPFDPWVFGGTTILLAGVALAAMFFAAWRPARVDPMIALRHE